MRCSWCTRKPASLVPQGSVHATVPAYSRLCPVSASQSSMVVEHPEFLKAGRSLAYRSVMWKLTWFLCWQLETSSQACYVI